jgi:hypothetical protein
MYPFPRYKPLNVALFLSTFDIENSLLEITLKLSFILRVASTFRVSKIYWIEDSSKSKKLKNIVNDLTKYMLLPPYLKKYISIKPHLRKVGMASPLNIPLHAVSRSGIEGEIRLGYKGDFGIINVKKLNTNYNSILILDSLNLDYIPYRNPYYNGVKMNFVKLEKILKLDNLIIASRSGKNPVKNVQEIINLYKKSGITLLIGPPKGNLLYKLGEKYLTKSYNFAINQGVSDIRVEEALAYSLSILNVLLS